MNIDTGNLKQYFKGDRIIWIWLAVMTCFSLVIVYSSTGALAYRQMGGNTAYYILRQSLFQGIGYFAILLMLNVIPFSWFNKYANFLYLCSFVLVGLGLIFGRMGEGTGRTLPLGIASFQPAEAVKVVIILWVARLLAKTQKDPRLLRIAFYKIMTGVGLLCSLIMLANFSSAALIFGTTVVMMYVGRVSRKYLGSVILIGITLVVVIYFTAPFLSEKLKIGRFLTIRNRIEREFQGDKISDKGLTQDDFAMIAIHRGGIIGAGKSEISNFMPAAYNDFVYSVIIEEYGLVGGFSVLLLYVIFLTRGGIIIRKCRNTFPLFLATGAVTMILLQATVNMVVSSGLIVTGQPLPWISWGGTSQIFTAVIFGLLLSVSKENDMDVQTEVGDNPGPGGVFPAEEYVMEKN
jgi:cell division protein FtsW